MGTTVVELIIILIIAGICGGVAQALLGMRRGNFLISVFIGMVGAYIGTYLAQRYGWPTLLTLTVGASTMDIGWVFIGALLLVFVLHLINGLSRPRRARR